VTSALAVIPLLIEFVAPSSLRLERNLVSAWPIIGNGPPGTFVVFPSGLTVSLPTDQIVFADDAGGQARVGFGGMQFVRLEEGQLIFVRARELFPEDQLSPARSHKMMLDARWVATMSIAGRRAWPIPSQSD
jgi:hypothetical protein